MESKSQKQVKFPYNRGGGEKKKGASRGTPIIYRPDAYCWENPKDTGFISFWTKKHHKYYWSMRGIPRGKKRFNIGRASEESKTREDRRNFTAYRFG